MQQVPVICLVFVLYRLNKHCESREVYGQLWLLQTQHYNLLRLQVADTNDATEITCHCVQVIDVTTKLACRPTRLSGQTEPLMLL